MIEKHDALKFINKVHEYLDNALSESECKTFIKDLHENPALMKILNSERNIRTIFKNQLQRSTVDDEFIESIKIRLYS